MFETGEDGGGGAQNSSNALGQGLGAARLAFLRPACRALFGNFDPFERLSYYENNNRIQTGSTYPANGTVTPTPFGYGDGAVTSYAIPPGVLSPSPSDPNRRISTNMITINTNGFFFSGTDPNGVPVNTIPNQGFVGLNFAQMRGAVIIHELLHAIGIFPPEGNNSAQSHANSRAVQEACFPLQPASTQTIVPLNSPIIR